MKKRFQPLLVFLAAGLLSLLGFSACAPRRAKALPREPQEQLDSLQRDSLLREQLRKRKIPREPEIRTLYGVPVNRERIYKP